MTLGRRQGELLAQLRELLLPSSSTAPPVKLVDCRGGGRPASSRRRRRRRGSKRGRDGDSTNGEQHEEPAQPPCSVKRSRKNKQQKSKSLVTSVPDFDGYQWRKYGQKQIEAAIYPRSYYRCTRSAEQGCPAKRTVQRNDDDGGAARTKYTVVYMGEHTCTANDSLEPPPVILETTAVVGVPADTVMSATNTNKRRPHQDDDDTTDSIIASATTLSASSCSTTRRIESPAISDDITWSSSDYVDDYSGLFSENNADSSWAPASAASSLQDFAGPIRSPVHIAAAAAADGYYWTIEQLLMQLVHEPL